MAGYDKGTGRKSEKYNTMKNKRRKHFKKE
jgi:hypothetical protein